MLIWYLVGSRLHGHLGVPSRLDFLVCEVSPVLLRWLHSQSGPTEVGQSLHLRINTVNKVRILFSLFYFHKFPDFQFGIIRRMEYSGEMFRNIRPNPNSKVLRSLTNLKQLFRTPLCFPNYCALLQLSSSIRFYYVRFLITRVDQNFLSYNFHI